MLKSALIDELRARGYNPDFDLIDAILALIEKDPANDKLLSRLGAYTAVNLFLWMRERDITGMTIRGLIQLYDADKVRGK